MVTETIRVTASANVEEVPVAGAAVGQTFDHGNRFNRVEIGPILRSEDDAGKAFDDGEGAMLWAMQHLDGLPNRGYLQLDFKGAKTSATLYYLGAIRQPTSLPLWIGEALQMGYSFTCGKISKVKP